MASAASSLKDIDKANPRFNQEAAGWDRNPFVHTASKHALDALLVRYPALNQSNPKLTNLEIGCGTGLLSFLISPYVKQVVAVDAADGMIEVLRQKLQRPEAPTNITPVAVLLEDPEDPALPDSTEPLQEKMKFDLITSHLVLHHIPDLQSVLQTMLGCLKPGGSVALTDFENFGPEAKRFHPRVKLEGVERHGIERKEMTELMKRVGFEAVDVEVGWVMEKKVERFEGEFGDKGHPGPGGQGEGETMKFPFVVCMGKRPLQ